MVVNKKPANKLNVKLLIVLATVFFLLFVFFLLVGSGKHSEDQISDDGSLQEHVDNKVVPYKQVTSSSLTNGSIVSNVTSSDQEQAINFLISFMPLIVILTVIFSLLTSLRFL